MIAEKTKYLPPSWILEEECLNNGKKCIPFLSVVEEGVRGRRLQVFHMDG